MPWIVPGDKTYMLPWKQEDIGSPRATRQRFSRLRHCRRPNMHARMPASTRWISTGDQAGFSSLPALQATKHECLHVTKSSLDLHGRPSSAFLASSNGSARATRQRFSRFGNKHPCAYPSARWTFTGDQAALFSPPAGASLQAWPAVLARVRVRRGLSTRARSFLFDWC